MKKQFRIITVVLCMAMLLSIGSSCKLFNDDTKSDSAQSDTSSSEITTESFKSKYTEEELATPVITIGKRTVTMDQYLDFFQEIYSYYKSSYGVDITETNETLTKYIDLITESLTKDTMILYQADELNLTDFTDEQKQEIEDKFEQEKIDMVEYYTDYVKNQDDTTESTDIDAEVEKRIIEEAEYYCGEGTTIEQYYDYLYKQTEDAYIKDLLFAEITRDVKVDDDDIKSWYDNAVDDDEEYFKEHPEGYKDECDSYDTTGYISDGTTAVAPLYVPEGYSRIYDICISADGEVSETYKSNSDKMSTLSTEYGKLAFENATNGATSANKERMEEILNEYNKLKKENEKELVEINKDAKTEIDKAYAELKSGTDFVTVMQNYTQNEDFQKGGAFAEKGELISTRYKSTSDWSDKIKSEFSKIGVGKYSEIFLDSDGYHIIYRVSNIKSGTRSLKDAKTEIESFLIVSKREEAYDAQITEWCDEGKNVIHNNELIEKLCK